MEKRTFADIPSDYDNYEKAKIVLLPVAYDETSTWGKGADKGPKHFLAAAENMELYDIETNSEPYLNGINLMPIQSKFKSPKDMVIKTKDIFQKTIEDNKVFTMIGGEHSVSIGPIMAASEKISNLSVLQLDAHADLRPEYNGSEYNHACAMHYASKNTNLVQVGIRSMDSSELAYIKKENFFSAQYLNSTNSDWQAEVLGRLSDNVYLSIDLDYFDPSILPDTGTPVPGGMDWYSCLKLLKQVAAKKNIVGFDIVELAPNKYSKASDFFAANLYYKILAYIFENK